jgi:protein-disulfide isomerase
VTLTRRKLLAGISAIAICSFAARWLEIPAPIGSAQAQTVSAAELMMPGPVPDRVLGAPDAPVTIVEYASFTCPHCATFATTTYPELKKRYIDTGKVRFIFRDFPLDQLAAAGSMLTQCTTGEKYFDLVEVLFQQQSRWVVNQPLAPLRAIAKQAGFTEKSFDECLSNQKMLSDLEQSRERASKQFGVNSTPTFFINGKIQRGALTIEELEKLIQPFLKS